MGETPPPECEALENRVHLAGVTVLTHGFQLTGNFPGWVDQMAVAIEARAGVPGMDTRHLRVTAASNGASGTIEDVRNTGAFSQARSAEAVVSINWADASNNNVLPTIFEPLVFTRDIASLGAASLLGTWDNIGNTGALAELPIHLIGHSRGAGVMSELARALGEAGIWVDQLTLLDPHPLEAGDAFFSVRSGGADPVISLFNNVITAENFRQNDSSFFPNGVAVPATHEVNLSPLSPDVSHSGVHAYYHGTIDRNAVSDGAGESISSAWYVGAPHGPRDQVGFARSRLGGLPPLASGTDARLGGTASRPPLTAVGPQWPNILLGSVASPLTLGQTTRIDYPIYYSDRDSGATVRAFFDVDTNPYNGTVADAGSTSVAQSDFGGTSVAIGSNGVAAGTYRLGFEITDGQRRRFQYAGQSVSVEYVLYFPEGNSTGNINEYLPIVNPNPYAVSYSVMIRYEWGERDQLLEQGVIGAFSRGGLTLYEGHQRQNSRVRLDVPYAVEVRSSGPLGATMSHYDFGVATGEAFSPDLSTEWTFAHVRRGQGSVDFLVWHNPGDLDALVTLTAVTRDGRTLADTRFQPAKRRGGISVNDMPWDIQGDFSVLISSTRPIIAALSHYEPSLGQGFIAIGTFGSGGEDAYAVFSPLDAQATVQAIVFNPQSTAVQVRLDVTYASGAPGTAQTFTLPARTAASYSASDLNLARGVGGFVRVRSSRPVATAMTLNDPSKGDGLSTQSLSLASSRWLFGDAFMSVAGAGTVTVEHLCIANPNDDTATVTIELLYLDGTRSQVSQSVPPRSVRTTALHQVQSILTWGSAHNGNNWFGIDVRSDRPTIASLTHWDQNQLGGWSSLGTPLGHWRVNAG